MCSGCFDVVVSPDHTCDLPRDVSLQHAFIQHSACLYHDTAISCFDMGFQLVQFTALAGLVGQLL